MISAMSFHTPEWPAPVNVRAMQTNRLGGVSSGVFSGLNLGDHVGDDIEHVLMNRQTVMSIADGLSAVWLQQVHGVDVLDVDSYIGSGNTVTPQADAALSRKPRNACVVMTADCLPVLLCDRAGTVVAAAHAGWRGLCDGVLEATVKQMRCDPADILAWLGPAIGPQAFEVGEDVRQAFLQKNKEATAAFQASNQASNAPRKWLANLYLLARQRLAACGVTAVYGGEQCTFSQADRYFSYRRDGQTGRMASLIWLDV